MSLNAPEALVVTIDAPWCFTPLQLTQLCVATIVTITPLLSSHTLSTETIIILVLSLELLKLISLFFGTIANLKINGIDSVGLVNKVTQIISKQLNVDIKSINISTNDGVFEGEITLKVHNDTFLSEITKKLEKIEGIAKISRTYKHSKNIKA